MSKYVNWIFKAPGLLRTVSATLGSAALIAEELVKDVDLSQGLTKAALYTAGLSILRLLGRKVVE